MTKPLGPSTASVHSGEPRLRPDHGITESIVQAVAFPFADTEAMIHFLDERKLSGETDRSEYGRFGNPTRRAAPPSWPSSSVPSNNRGCACRGCGCPPSP